ncbi:cation diffusion facilitator family transporter [Anaerorhabdus sp.]|uniref:cation diffusion facilitator family transporter n=1 Tax=Anaerorhabdus sp. TaxID=1872524 RepID=UPI002FCC96F1
MINMIVKRFVKDYENVTDETVRARYGTLSSLVGIVCNILLFCLKMILGILSQSIAITSDAFNNLSDSASCIVTLFGYKLAAKPADKDHPFGHGRIEYIVSLIIAVIILLVGFELFKSSFEKILNPTPIHFSWVVLVSLLLSIFVKFWMSYFNRTLGKRINNSAMIATSKDSQNDVIATSATVIALVGSSFTSLPLDGAMGILVSVFVFISGCGIIKSTFDDLIGQPADEEIVEQIKNIITKEPQILGVHDLIIHTYGPGKMIGSVHVEVNSNQSFLIIHDVVDEIERKIANDLHIMMTIHMDPIEQDNEIVNQYKEIIENILIKINSNLSMHDFRLVSGPTHINLIFDVLVPYELKINDDDLKKNIDNELSKYMSNVYTVITFDRGYY